MPTYQYACTVCDERTEVVQSFTDTPLTECAACQGNLRKVFSAVGVVFKGSGFYKNDSREPVKSAAKKEPATAGSSEGASSSGDAKSGDAKSGAGKDKGSGDGPGKSGGTPSESKPSAGGGRGGSQPAGSRSGSPSATSGGKPAARKSA